MNTKLTAAEKPAAMAAIGADWAVISAAEEQVHAMKVAAAPKIKQVVDSFGAGPHKMGVPQSDGGHKDFIASFRKAGDEWNTSAVSLSDVQ